MMKNEKHFFYQGNDVIRAVRLPYGNGAYSMTVILPADGKILSDVSNYLDNNTWEDFQRKMVMCKVDLWLPKYETKFDINLNGILSAMGMSSAFDPVKADFKAMSDAAMCLSVVKQKAAIKVDEEGTEAAVVSMTGLDMAAGPIATDHIVFHADRPFLYLITESSTGVILFAGKYSGR
jgi:serpin B